jgi:signal transduction histidine kinase
MDGVELREILATMPLLAEFSSEQREWVAEHGEVVEVVAGTVVLTEGDADAGFWILLRGRVAILRTEEGRVEVSGTTEHVGSWGGRIPMSGEPSPITLRAESNACFLRFSDSDADAMLAGGMPLGKHIIAGIQAGSRRFEARLRERDRLTSLGRLSAGLAHELNNPAAAVRRAAAQLRVVLAEQQRLSICLRAEPDVLELLAAAQAELTAGVGAAEEPAPELTALQRADLEESLADWLQDRGMDDGYEAAAVLADAGVDGAWLDAHLSTVPAATIAPVVQVMVAAMSAHQLASEIEAASARISELVGAIKSYSNMDGASLQDVDVRKGVISTLMMLKHRLQGVTVGKEFEADLPTVPGNPGELNQVWTNLIDNAADALSGKGTLTIRASAAEGGVVVEVSDDGPGMPEEVRSRVFDPFFTTKGVGAGTGMGLDFVWRIVVENHKGSINVASTPGVGTTFRVLLPGSSQQYSSQQYSSQQ